MSGEIKATVAMDSDYTTRAWVNTFLRHSMFTLDAASTSSSAEVFVQEYEELDFDRMYEAKDTTAVLFNSYCIRKGLIRKAQVGYYLKKFTAKRPDSVLKAAVPDTYFFEVADVDYFDEAMNEVFEVDQALEENLSLADQDRQVFILKPSMIDKASNLFIFDTRDQLFEFLDSRFDEAFEDEDLGDVRHLREWVIQRYIDRPLLVSGRKFHLRAYVVAYGACDVFLYRDLLALCAGRQYKRGDYTDPYVHLTNTCVQAEADDFAEEQVQRFWALPFAPEELDRMYNDIKQVLGDIFAAVVHEPLVFQALPNCYEVFGFDFMVDLDRQVYFLEANAFPDFQQTGADLSSVIEGLFDAVVTQVMEPHFRAQPPILEGPLERVYSNTNTHT